MSPSVHPSARTQFLGALLGMGIAVVAYTSMNATSTLESVKGYLASDPRISQKSAQVRVSDKNIDDATLRTLQKNARVVAENQKVEMSSSASVQMVVLKNTSENSSDLHTAAPEEKTVASVVVAKKYSRLALRSERLAEIASEHSGAPEYKPIADPISPEEAYKGKGKKGISQPIPAPIIPQVSTPTPIIREVRVPVATPPKVILREIKVPTPAETIIREVRVPVKIPPKVVVREVPVREPTEHLTDSGMGLNIALIASLFGAFFLVRSNTMKEEM